VKQAHHEEIRKPHVREDTTSQTDAVMIRVGATANMSCILNRYIIFRASIRVVRRGRTRRAVDYHHSRRCRADIWDPLNQIGQRLTAHNVVNLIRTRGASKKARRIEAHAGNVGKEFAPHGLQEL
jgi:hypothetical protein